jgi:glucose repression mediator protein
LRLIRPQGNFYEMIPDLTEALHAYEHALRANPRSIPAMSAISTILRTQEHFPKAVEYLNQILKLDPANGDCWGSLGELHSSANYEHVTKNNRTLLLDDG